MKRTSALLLCAALTLSACNAEPTKVTETSQVAKATKAAKTTKTTEPAKPVELIRMEGDKVAGDQEYSDRFGRLIFGDYDWHSAPGFLAIEPRTVDGVAFKLPVPEDFNLLDTTAASLKKLFGTPARQDGDRYWYTTTAGNALLFEFTEPDTDTLSNVLLVADAEDLGSTQPLTRFGEYALDFGMYGPHRLGDSTQLWPNGLTGMPGNPCQVSQDYEVTGYFHDDVLVGLEVDPSKLGHANFPIVDHGNLMDPVGDIATRFDATPVTVQDGFAASNQMPGYLLNNEQNPRSPILMGIYGEDTEPAPKARTGNTQFVSTLMATEC